MRRGPEHNWLADERALDAPEVSIEIWNLIDANKALHFGWFVVEKPTTKDLKKLIKDGVIAAIEADECPVRFTYESEGRVMNFPMGLSEQKVKHMIFEAEKENRKQQSV